MSGNSVSFHRIIKAQPEKVFKAFTDPLALAYWLPPYGFLCNVHALDLKVGDTIKMSFQNFSTGSTHSFGGEYLEIVPGNILKYTNVFDDPNLLGTMTVSVSFKKCIVGTELNITQVGIPDKIPTAFCYLGWQESLEKLIKLVEPNIPDGE